MIQLRVLFGIFLAFADHLFQQRRDAFGAVAIGMDPGGFNNVEVLIDEGFADLPQRLLDFPVFCLNQKKLSMRMRRSDAADIIVAQQESMSRGALSAI